MSRIPDEAEYQAWRAGYKRRYAAPIQAFGDAAFKAAGAQKPVAVVGGGTPKYAEPVEPKEISVQQFDDDMAALQTASEALDAAEKIAERVGRGQEGGYRVGRAGMGADMNPHEDRSDEFYAWYKGWRSGNKDHQWRKGKQSG